jgi:hypothetical protein
MVSSPNMLDFSTARGPKVGCKFVLVSGWVHDPCIGSTGSVDRDCDNNCVNWYQNLGANMQVLCVLTVVGNGWWDRMLC